jgi:branched-subunit amino acid permease
LEMGSMVEVVYNADSPGQHRLSPVETMGPKQHIFIAILVTVGFFITAIGLVALFAEALA